MYLDDYGTCISVVDYLANEKNSFYTWKDFHNYMYNHWNNKYVNSKRADCTVVYNGSIYSSIRFDLFKIARKIRIIYNYNFSDETILSENLNEAVAYYRRYILNRHNVNFHYKALDTGCDPSLVLDNFPLGE